MEDKKNDYTLKEEQIARFAKALGHPARVAILHFLAKREACYFGAIHEELPIAKATVSQHLKELKEGRPIRCPVYSYVEHNRTKETREILPTKVIIVEGILIFQNPLSGICLTLRSLWRRMPTSAFSAVLCGMWRNGAGPSNPSSPNTSPR